MISDKSFVSVRSATMDAIVHCTNCKFTKCQTFSNSGGAISAFSNVVLINCIFTSCSAVNGGAISVINDVQMHTTTFDFCSVTQNGGSLYTSNANHVSIEYSYFLRSFAISGGGIDAISRDYTHVTNTNFSACFSSSQGGGMNLVYGSSTIDFGILSMCTASYSGAGFSLILTKQVILQSLYFISMQASSPQNDKIGCALHVTGLEKNSSLAQSSFIQTQATSGYTAYFDFNSKSSFIRFIGNCFTDPIDRAFNRDFVVEVEGHTIFDVEKCSLTVARLPRYIGYVVPPDKVASTPKVDSTLIVALVVCLVFVGLIMGLLVSTKIKRRRRRRFVG